MSNNNPGGRWTGIAYLLATVFGWGLNWPGIKLLLRELPPLFSRGLAGYAAVALLAGIALWRGERLSLPAGALPRMMFAALTNVIGWMGLTLLAMQWLSVAEGALLIYTMPIWAMLLAWPILGERPKLRGLAGLVLALAGIGILLGGRGLALDSGKIIGIVLALVAAALFGLGTVVNRKPSPVQPFASVMWQVGLGCAPLIVFGLLFEPLDFSRTTVTGWSVLAYMTLVPMSLCYLTWFAALRYLPAATAATGMLLTPLIGIVAGAIVLGEPLGWPEAAAIVVTLSGVTLALRPA